MKIYLDLLWQPKRLHMHKKLNKVCVIFDNRNRADLQKNVKINTALGQEKIPG